MKGSFIRDAFFIIIAAGAIGLIYNNYSAKELDLWREKTATVETSDDEILSKLGDDKSETTDSALSKAAEDVFSADSHEDQPPSGDSANENRDHTAGNAQGSGDQNTQSHADAGGTNKKGLDQVKPAEPTQSSKNTENAAENEDADEEHDLGPVKVVKYDQVVKMLGNDRVQFIDARNAEEFAEGHIGNAVNIFTPEHEEHLPEMLTWPRDKLYVVYCGGGNCDLSIELAEVLTGFGFENVYVYKGGTTEWNAKQGK